MFTVAQIEQAHAAVKSGADFPNYIQAIKTLGVTAFETWVNDSHTVYFGRDHFSTRSAAKYELLPIADTVQAGQFAAYLKSHQQGQTDYYTFCVHCAETGVEKWYVCLEEMTCTYYDKEGKEVLVEAIPG